MPLVPALFQKGRFAQIAAEQGASPRVAPTPREAALNSALSATLATPDAGWLASTPEEGSGVGQDESGSERLGGVTERDLTQLRWQHYHPDRDNAADPGSPLSDDSSPCSPGDCSSGSSIGGFLWDEGVRMHEFSELEAGFVLEECLELDAIVDEALAEASHQADWLLTYDVDWEQQVLEQRSSDIDLLSGFDALREEAATVRNSIEAEGKGAVGGRGAELHISCQGDWVVYQRGHGSPRNSLDTESWEGSSSHRSHKSLLSPLSAGSVKVAMQVFENSLDTATTDERTWLDEHSHESISSTVTSIPESPASLTTTPTATARVARDAAPPLLFGSPGPSDHVLQEAVSYAETLESSDCHPIAADDSRADRADPIGSTLSSVLESDEDEDSWLASHDSSPLISPVSPLKTVSQKLSLDLSSLAGSRSASAGALFPMSARHPLPPAETKADVMPSERLPSITENGGHGEHTGLKHRRAKHSSTDCRDNSEAPFVSQQDMLENVAKLSISLHQQSLEDECSWLPEVSGNNSPATPSPIDQANSMAVVESDEDRAWPSSRGTQAARSSDEEYLDCCPDSSSDCDSDSVWDGGDEVYLSPSGECSQRSVATRAGGATDMEHVKMVSQDIFQTDFQQPSPSQPISVAATPFSEPSENQTPTACIPPRQDEEVTSSSTYFDCEASLVSPDPAQLPLPKLVIPESSLPVLSGDDQPKRSRLFQSFQVQKKDQPTVRASLMSDATLQPRTLALSSTEHRSSHAPLCTMPQPSAVNGQQPAKLGSSSVDFSQPGMGSQLSNSWLKLVPGASRPSRIPAPPSRK